MDRGDIREDMIREPSKLIAAEVMFTDEFDTSYLVQTSKEIARESEKDQVCSNLPATTTSNVQTPAHF